MNLHPSPSAPGSEPGGEGGGSPGATHSARPVSVAFRNIQLVVSLILVFAAGQTLMLSLVCARGMKTAHSLEHQGLPTLGALASLEQSLAIYRLNSYEYLFAHEEDRAAKTKEVETVAGQMRAELANLQRLLPAGEGWELAVQLEAAITDLDTEFRKVRGLVDSDFEGAMRAMDQDIPPRTAHVSMAAAALRDFGYGLSGRQANATFGSFGWIKNTALLFGTANILGALGAVIFVRLAARRSGSKLAETLTRLDERSLELRESQQLLQSTIHALTAHIAILDASGTILEVNHAWSEFARLNSLAGNDCGVGGNYLRICDTASGICSKEAVASAVGIRAVIAGHTPLFELEYPCHSPTQKRWFVVRVTRFIGDGPVRVVVAHENITARKNAEEDLVKLHRQLLETSRHAGMAEVATGVLHNVGNVLNSVNVSAALVAENVKKSKAISLGRVVGLLESRSGDIGEFISRDPQGKMLPSYLRQLDEKLAEERRTIAAEVASLRENIEHIKDIVAMQQTYAKVSGVTEILQITDLVEDSLRMNAGALTRHEVQVVREFQEVPPISVEKHKVLQILVNLIRNAKYACDDAGLPDKRMTLRVVNGGGTVKISVADNGVGIPAENLTRIFNHGFTTRKDGHGFGLHSGALAAKELGGSLRVESEGPGRGATFTLELPVETSAT